MGLWLFRIGGFYWWLIGASETDPDDCTFTASCPAPLY